MATATVNPPMRQRELSYPADTPQAVRTKAARLHLEGQAFAWNESCVVRSGAAESLTPSKPCLCIMEAIYVALLGDWSKAVRVGYRPNQVEFSLIKAMYRLNDGMGEGSESDGLRLEYLVPLVTSLPGSSLKSKPDLGYIYADWACRVIAPLALDARGSHNQAAKLRSIQSVVDEKTARAAADAAYAARAAAYAAVYAAADAAAYAAVYAAADAADAAYAAADAAAYAADAADAAADAAAYAADAAAKAITWPKVMHAVYGMLIAVLEQVADSREWVLIDQNNQFIRIFRPADEVAALKARLLEAGQLAPLPVTIPAS